MENFYDAVQEALGRARAANYTVDQNVCQMAQLIQGRLRAAGSLDWKTVRAFNALKKELDDWNAKSGTWRELRK